MIKNNNTKNRIELVALDLFSQKGYKAASIREICRIVGIKESSVYYHFKNKQAIMDALLAKIDFLIKAMKDKFNSEFSHATEVSEEDMCEVAVGVLLNYLLNPYVYKMIAILTIERMADSNASTNYQRIVFELPLLQQEQVFKQMIDRSYVRENSPIILAQEYYAVIYFSFQKNCIGCELTEERKHIACEEIRKNIRDIYGKMR
ncbi:MAG: TetR/AcrR family transcriptional regulator [Lachnotalea sp.]